MFCFLLHAFIVTTLLYFLLGGTDSATGRPRPGLRSFAPPLRTEARLYIFLVLFQNYGML